MERALSLRTSSLTLRRTIAVLLGTALVSAAAQVSVPLPGTPVPFTLQPLAVLLVGGLLGPSLGAASLVLYLGLGAAGLPVFSPIGLPGIARLIGPTGGYLLAFPVAAAVTGRLVGDGRHVARLALACLAGMALIYLGGLVQLLLLTGSLGAAAQFGTFPFIGADLVKIGLAAVLLRRTLRPVRARL